MWVRELLGLLRLVILDRSYGRTTEIVTVVALTLMVCIITKAVLRFVAMMSHRKWQRAIGVGNLWQANHVEGKTREEFYNTFIRLPMNKDLYIRPRKGLVREDFERYLKQFSWEFLGQGRSGRFVACVYAGPLWRWLGFPLKLVWDRTSRQVKESTIERKWFFDWRVRRQYGAVALGICEAGRLLLMDLFGSSMTIISGASRTGKSVILYRLLALTSRMKEITPVVLDLTGVFPKKGSSGFPMGKGSNRRSEKVWLCGNFQSSENLAQRILPFESSN